MKKSLNRRDFLKSLAAGVAVSGIPMLQCKTNVKQRPNIVIILSDDQGWGDLGINGNADLETPFIDSLAREGALIENFFVCPVCSPTRAELLTGRYHLRSGVRGVTQGNERMDLDEKTLADSFKSAGYATAAFGKWHNGAQYPYHPNGRGFDEYYGFCSGHWGQYFDPVLEHNGEIVRGKGYISDDLTDHALDFIEKNKDKPFLCYLPFNTPHSPMQVPDRFFDKFKNTTMSMKSRYAGEEDKEHTRAAYAMCENIDWNVGRILDKLEKLNLEENTIVIYFSDNGPNGWRWNGTMKGKKGSTDEGGVRVPCVIRWPGHIKSGTEISQITAAIDLLPTLTDLTGISHVGEKSVDGKSIKPLLLEKNVNWPDRKIFTHWNGRVSVRTQQYRLDHEGMLYDMVKDPGQNKDISQEKPKIAEELRTAVEKWKKEMPVIPDQKRPFPVGYKEFPGTILPARDGIPNGNIKRSSRHANCTFFTNWVNKEDSMSWDIEVANAGTYDVTIYYTCAKENIGSVIECVFKNNRIVGKVTEPFDPPLIGEAFDRVPRAESYVKNFKKLQLSGLSMQKGRGDFILQALDIPGKQVMDVRAVVLTLLS